MTMNGWKPTISLIHPPPIHELHVYLCLYDIFSCHMHDTVCSSADDHDVREYILAACIRYKPTCEQYTCDVTVSMRSYVNITSWWSFSFLSNAGFSNQCHTHLSPLTRTADPSRIYVYMTWVWRSATRWIFRSTVSQLKARYCLLDWRKSFALPITVLHVAWWTKIKIV